MTFAKHIRFENLLDKNKMKKQKQKQKQQRKFYTLSFDQSFDLRRFSKLKMKIRESLDIFEILKLLENFTQNQIIQHFLDKIEFIDQFDNQIVVAQNQIVVAQNVRNAKFKTRFDQIQN